MSVINATVGSVKFRVPDWLEPLERYRRRYIVVDPEGGVSSDEPGLHPDPGVRLWSVRSWAGGEGETLWDPEERRFRKSDGVTLVELGDGLQLSRKAETTQDSSGVADFQDGRRFGFGLGGLWAAEDGAAYEWDRTNERWGAGVTTGAGTSNATSLTDGDDGTNMFSGHEDLKIYKWSSGANAVHYNTGTGDDFTYAPVVRSWGGRLYALDGDDLYEIDKDTANTRTLRADVPGSSDDYLTTTPWAYNRMSLSDKGPIWIQRLDNGQTLIWEYNVNLDTQDVIAKLSVDWAFPYSIFYTNGFVVIGFRYANAHTESGPGHIFFARGAQKGVAGPFRAQSGVTASKPVLVGGQIGDDLICYFDGYVWAYNFTDAGIRQIAAETLGGGPPEDFVTFGQDVFAGPYTSLEVERWLADEYVASGTLDSGRHDFDYPGLKKLVQNVGVVTDPLPAATSVTVKVAVDGGTATALSGTHEVDGSRRFVWAASTPGSDLPGWEVELQVALATTDSTVTPTIRQMWATATGAAHRIEFVVAVDLRDDRSWETIDDLNGLIGSTQTFSDPFQNRGSDGADSIVVTVEEVQTPEMIEKSTKERPYALVRMRSRDLVGVLGSS